MSSVDLPLVPCSECGDTDPAHHVYGVMKCCPDCRHDLADHDRQVAERIAQAIDDGWPDPIGLYTAEQARVAGAVKRYAVRIARAYRADSLAPRPAAPGVSVSAVVADTVQAHFTDFDEEWRDAGCECGWLVKAHPDWQAEVRADHVGAMVLAALGITVTDGGA